MGWLCCRLHLNLCSSDISSFSEFGQACVSQAYRSAVSQFIKCSTYQNLSLYVLFPEKYAQMYTMYTYKNFYSSSIGTIQELENTRI